MGFSYRYTCPIIDDNINEFRDTVEDFLKDVIHQCSPLVSDIDLDKKAEEYEEDLYNMVEKYFENLRACNSDMRDEADEQIENVENEVEEKEEQIRDLDDRIEELEKEVEELKDEIYYKNEEIDNLKDELGQL